MDVSQENSPLSLLPPAEPQGGAGLLITNRGLFIGHPEQIQGALAGYVGQRNELRRMALIVFLSRASCKMNIYSDRLKIPCAASSA